jgi:hypothetical protein
MRKTRLSNYSKSGRTAEQVKTKNRRECQELYEKQFDKRKQLDPSAAAVHNEYRQTLATG